MKVSRSNSNSSNSSRRNNNSSSERLGTSVLLVTERGVWKDIWLQVEDFFIVRNVGKNVLTAIITHLVRLAAAKVADTIDCR